MTFYERRGGYKGPTDSKPLQPYQTINPRPTIDSSLKTIKIILTGCDDNTTFTVEVDDKELAILNRVAKLSQETSEYNCMPKMKVFNDKNETG